MSDVGLVLALPAMVALVIAWEWSHSSSNDIEESDGEIVCYIGDHAPGAKFTRTVPLRNKTSERQTIKSISRSCSCLATALDRNAIEPGEVANLTLEFSSPPRQSAFQHNVVVAFAENQQPVTIRLVGTVSAWIRPSVPALEFAPTYPGETKVQTIQLRVREPWPRSDQQVKSLMPHTRIESTKSENDGKFVTYTLAFEPPAGAQAKECEGDLVINWLGHDDRGLNLPCHGKIATEWVAEMSQIVLGKVAAKQAPHFAVRLGNTRHSSDAWKRSCGISADPAGLVDVSWTRDGEGWLVTGSIKEEGFVGCGVKSAAVCVTAPDNPVPFRIPVFWETE
jgi:Protein of unknown function (DUF1573)